MRTAMKRSINLIFILIFILTISLPCLFAHRSREGRVSDMENRTLAAYPSLRQEDGGLNREYPAELEEWLNDNLRGRTALVELNSTLQYRLFQRIVKSDILQGKDHWLFVKDPEYIREYQRMNLMSEEELKKYASDMQNISDYLKEKGIAFYYFQCYGKEEIYPGKYAEGINRMEESSKADQIVDALQQYTDVKQILTKQILTERAGEEIYFKFVDSLHWNERGSYYGYRALMDEIHKDFEQASGLEETDFLIREEERSVELYGFAYPYREMCPVYEVKDPHAVEITRDTLERWNFLHFKEHTHDYVNEGCENDLRILILGDSFVRMFMKEDLAESFYQTLSIDWLNLPILDEVVAEYQPDIVVLESAQSALANTVALAGETDFTGK